MRALDVAKELCIDDLSKSPLVHSVRLSTGVDSITHSYRAPVDSSCWVIRRVGTGLSVSDGYKAIPYSCCPRFTRCCSSLNRPSRTNELWRVFALSLRNRENQHLQQKVSDRSLQELARSDLRTQNQLPGDVEEKA